jgi:hypothetical protein
VWSLVRISGSVSPCHAAFWVETSFTIPETDAAKSPIANSFFIRLLLSMTSHEMYSVMLLTAEILTKRFPQRWSGVSGDGAELRASGSVK